MARAAASEGKAAPAKEGLSEIRTTVLGPQILLGFQYEAVFQPGFPALSGWRKALELVALALLLLTIALVISPASHHQIAERGERSEGQTRYDKLMLFLSLAPFALAIGASIPVAIGADVGAAAAVGAAAVAVLVAIFLWYGVELMVRRRGQPARAQAAGKAALKDKIEDIMTETRIVLPGVQALLGFQLAAYLTSAFQRLTAEARAAHDCSLAFLLLSMVLLMTPAPFHRIAEEGRDTERAHKVGAGLVLAALAALAVGLALDVFVAAVAAGLSTQLGAAGAGVGVVVLATAWFAAPLAMRRPRAKVTARGRKDARVERKDAPPPASGGLPAARSPLARRRR